MVEDLRKQITTTWLSGSCSCTMVIPKEFAKKHGLDRPGHVTVEESPDGEGILVKPLNID